MKRGPQGKLRAQKIPGESFNAFIPNPLPPTPPLAWDETLRELLDKANLALGRLDGITLLLPDISLFLYMYVRKEAVLSSQIEGTQSSLSDLLLFENEGVPGAPLDDVQEVSNYVAALNHGLSRLREDFPLSLRLIREIHQVLLAKGRGSGKEPGEFRRSQNWVGGTRPGNAIYVPPPQEEVLPCMGELEKFLHQKTDVPFLAKIALAHVQFETVHPFLDGNGRLGRLLITFLLCSEKILKEPVLYLSLYFKTHRQLYYDHLQQVRLEGDWEAWLRFFLEGVQETADQATDTARRLVQLFIEDKKKIEQLRRSANTVLRVHEYLQKNALLTIPKAVKDMGMTHPTVTLALKNLQKLGIIEETTGRQRNRVFAYREYLNILNAGTEPFNK